MSELNSMVKYSVGGLIGLFLGIGVTNIHYKGKPVIKLSGDLDRVTEIRYPSIRNTIDKIYPLNLNSIDKLEVLTSCGDKIYISNETAKSIENNEKKEEVQ